MFIKQNHVQSLKNLTNIANVTLHRFWCNLAMKEKMATKIDNINFYDHRIFLSVTHVLFLCMKFVSGCRRLGRRMKASTLSS